MGSGSRRSSPVVSAAALAWGALLLYVVTTHPVWTAAPMEIALDPSWRAAYHHAFANGWQFGTDVVFTFGPYGFLLAHVYDPATFATSVTLNLALVVASTAFLIRWGLSLGVHPAWIALAVLLVADGAAVSSDSGFVALIALPLFCVFFRRREGPGVGWLHALAAGLALMSLVKHSYAVAAGVVLATCAIQSLRDREPPWFLATFALAWLLLWLAAGQSLGNLGHYGVGVWEILRGYSEAMSRPGPVWEVAAAGGAGLVLAIAVGRTFVAKHGAWGWLPALCAAALFALLMKSSFVRQDAPHIAYAAGGWTGLSALAGIAAVSQWREHRSLALGLVAGLVVHGAVFALILGLRDVESPYPLSIIARVGDVPVRASRSFTALFDPDRNRERYEASRRTIREWVPLPPLRGAVDLLPDDLTIVLAHGLDYRARPSIQSYAAFTPRLLENNRSFFAGPRAPRYVLFSMAPLDKRYPALPDGLSWPTLLARYQIVGHSSYYLLLWRDDAGRGLERSLLAEREISLSETTPIPPVADGEILWAELELERTGAGALLAALFRPPRVWLDLSTRDGRQGRFRLIPEMARAGFALSPLVANTLDFQQLASSRSGPLWGDQAATAIRIEVAEEMGQTSAYAPTARLRLFALRWERAD